MRLSDTKKAKTRRAMQPQCGELYLTTERNMLITPLSYLERHFLKTNSAHRRESSIFFMSKMLRPATQDGSILALARIKPRINFRDFETSLPF